MDARQRKPTELKRIHIEPVIKLDHFTVVGKAREKRPENEVGLLA